MAEVEVGGVKFTGGKMFAVITALSTLGGVAWGAFEFYNDYRNMKEQISEYVAPDLSGINERISVMEEQVVNAVDNTRTIKLDLKRDIQNIETQVDRVEQIVKDTQDSIDATLREVEIVNRESEKDTRDRMRETEDRIDASMQKLEKKLGDQIQEALDNPLTNN
jgi:predicted  nucleic acid-binding Zn-ribbon protein|tara:strand:- start:1246 stop:1737 length:492 start_codon:yes stop_codon:yes gene_type:complete